MNSKLIYWTLNSKQEAFFLDGDGQCRGVLKDGKAIVGREAAANYLAEQRPHHKIIWLDSPEQLHNLAVEMKMGERDLDARSLAQIATTVRNSTPS